MTNSLARIHPDQRPQLTCDKCKKPVEALYGEYNDFEAKIILIAHCHGQTDMISVSNDFLVQFGWPEIAFPLGQLNLFN